MLPVSITMCPDSGSSNGCIDVPGLAFPMVFFDVRNTLVNPGTVLNPNGIKGVTTIQVNTPGVSCTFGGTLISQNPYNICGGYTQ
jgi:hypothetical protein